MNISAEQEAWKKAEVAARDKHKTPHTAHDCRFCAQMIKDAIAKERGIILRD